MPYHRDDNGDLVIETRPLAICDSCSRNLRESDGVPVCSAFPDGIPRDITFRGYDHREPYEGDGGKQHQLIDSPQARELLDLWEGLNRGN